MTPYGFPDHAFHCLLDEQPYYLVPPRLYGWDPDGSLVVNPDTWFSWHGPLPADKAGRVNGNGALHEAGGWQVWVPDVATGAVWPYWIGDEYAAHLWGLVPGQAAPGDLPDHMRWVLARAQILVDEHHAQRRRWEWHSAVHAASTAFAERGYAVLPGLVPAFHLGALRRYYRYHTRVGSFALGDGQVAQRHVAHNEPVARFLLGQLATAVSDVARTIVKPSYAYLAAYESGSTLERHTDREQCEYTITFCVDSSPEPHEQSLWPIHLDVADGSLAVWQYLGDALLFRGRYLPHYREPLAPGHTSTSLLLHYVDEAFESRLD
jgi:hypothetical protein